MSIISHQICLSPGTNKFFRIIIIYANIDTKLDGGMGRSSMFIILIYKQLNVKIN